MKNKHVRNVSHIDAYEVNFIVVIQFFHLLSESEVRTNFLPNTER